jgi:hypothetical protein
LEGFAMGATTNSITGLFANVCVRKTCGRLVREQNLAGHGTRSAATRGYPSLAHSLLRHFSLRQELDTAIDQARWLLKWLGGQLKPGFSMLFSSKMAGISSPAFCPANPQSGCPARLQAVGRLSQGALRFEG